MPNHQNACNSVDLSKNVIMNILRKPHIFSDRPTSSLSEALSQSVESCIITITRLPPFSHSYIIASLIIALISFPPISPNISDCSTYTWTFAGDSLPSDLDPSFPARLCLLPRPPAPPPRPPLRPLLLRPVVQSCPRPLSTCTSTTQLLPLPVKNSPLARRKTSLHWPHLLSGTSPYRLPMSPNIT